MYFGLIITLAIACIPDLRFLVWEVDPVLSPTLYGYSFGILLISFVLYGYLVIGIALILLLRGLKVFSTYLKRHTLIFLIASLLPVLFNILHLFKIDPLRKSESQVVGTAYIFQSLKG